MSSKSSERISDGGAVAVEHAEMPALVPENGRFEGQIAVVGETRIEGAVQGSLRGPGTLHLGESAHVEGIIDCADRVRKIIHFDFVYSSACPCASELSEHAREKRNLLAIPHSQRSKARISVEVHPDKEISLLDLRDLCISGLSTETQVMVRREDEQAFAELNAANPIFVEDAARLFALGLQKDARIGDFRVMASHQESLHSHDAVSVLTQGETFAADSIDPRGFASLIHVG